MKIAIIILSILLAISLGLNLTFGMWIYGLRKKFMSMTSTIRTLRSLLASTVKYIKNFKEESIQENLQNKQE